MLFKNYQKLIKNCVNKNMKPLFFDCAFPNTTNQFYVKIFNLIEYRRNNPLKWLPGNKRKDDYIYCEQHHIIPKSWYLRKMQIPVDNSEENLIYLTIFEHIQIHIWLKLYYKDINDILMMHMMESALMYICGGNNEKKQSLNSIDQQYELIKMLEQNRIDYIKYKQEEMTGKTWYTNGKKFILIHEKDKPIGFWKQGHPQPDEAKLKLSLEFKNRKWYTDGLNDIFLSPDDEIPLNFYEGRSKLSGKIIVTNGIEFIFSDKDNIPIGYQHVNGNGPNAGRRHSEKTKQKMRKPKPIGFSENVSKRIKGTIQVTNGIIFKQVLPDQIPNGFWKQGFATGSKRTDEQKQHMRKHHNGKNISLARKGKKQYTNGKIIKLFKPGTQPDGWKQVAKR